MINFWSTGKHTPSLKGSCFNDHLLLPEEPTTSFSFSSPSSAALSSNRRGEVFRLFQLSHWYYSILAKTLNTGAMPGLGCCPLLQLGKTTGHTSATPSMWCGLRLRVRNRISVAAWHLNWHVGSEERINGKEIPAWTKPLHTGMQEATQGLISLTEAQPCASAVSKLSTSCKSWS